MINPYFEEFGIDFPPGMETAEGDGSNAHSTPEQREKAMQEAAKERDAERLRRSTT